MERLSLANSNVCKDIKLGLLYSAKNSYNLLNSLSRVWILSSKQLNTQRTTYDFRLAPQKNQIQLPARMYSPNLSSVFAVKVRLYHSPFEISGLKHKPKSESTPPCGVSVSEYHFLLIA